MILKTYNLEEIHANLWGPHNLPLLTSRIYVGLLLNEFTHKSWILTLRSTGEYFDTFKLWLSRAKASCGEKLGCL